MGIENNHSKNILICPLDWGIGHASRVIPIIKKLQSKGHHIFIACSKQQHSFFKNEITNYTWIPSACPSIKYSEKKLSIFDLIRLIPIIFVGIKKDKKKIDSWVKKHHIQIVISDNRYGCYSQHAYSVIITHQVKVELPKKLKWAEKILHKRIKKMIYKFNRCWIPDIKEMPNFAGDLSLQFSLNGKSSFIGLLSRFDENQVLESQPEKTYEVIGIVSGPEPQRTIFAKLLLQQMKELQKPCLLVLGDFSKPTSNYQDDNVSVYSSMNTKELYKAFQSSKFIVARSGYSTIMDLISLRRTAILVPTPGQTEQEYLARYYKSRRMFVIADQDKLNLAESLSELSVYSCIYHYNANENFEQELEMVLN
ncbi:MAG: UDP-N-acetylglucosamine--N-acetylmuramyl-(pentapeptide) pyrophosphoryl-undecaprenol N-acetylglucosamine transferase [Bacteroidales bacterium]|nr:UDP-N-acetylglucosamine--N-acetylmuramyl-(pentapeptide) pyrophosphoryl-undecaprenol N-acetylglucosamine transferase [Bacteroidales bacterium]